MEAGKLFQEVTIQQRNETLNLLGESVANWVTFQAVYAESINKGGNETIIADQVDAIWDTIFRIRFISGIRATMRIVHRSRNYNIVHIAETDDRMEEMLVLCKREENSTNG